MSSKLTSSTIFTCEGTNDGACGVHHRTLYAARQCCLRHEESIRRETDRQPYVRSGVLVTLRVVDVGLHFGCVGQVRARNGKVLWSSDTKPYGFDDAARRAARDEAETQGWTVLS